MKTQYVTSMSYFLFVLGDKRLKMISHETWIEAFRVLAHQYNANQPNKLMRIKVP